MRASNGEHKLTQINHEKEADQAVSRPLWVCLQSVSNFFIQTLFKQPICHNQNSQAGKPAGSVIRTCTLPHRDRARHTAACSCPTNCLCRNVRTPMGAVLTERQIIQPSGHRDRQDGGTARIRDKRIHRDTSKHTRITTEPYKRALR